MPIRVLDPARQDGDREALGAMLKAMRETAGLSAKKAAQEKGPAKRTASYVRLIESGQRRPSVAVLTGLLESYGVDYSVAADGVSFAFEGSAYHVRVQETRKRRSKGSAVPEGVSIADVATAWMSWVGAQAVGIHTPDERSAPLALDSMVFDRDLDDDTIVALIQALPDGERVSVAAAARQSFEPLEGVLLTDRRLLTFSAESLTAGHFDAEWSIGEIDDVRWVDLGGTALEVLVQDQWQRIADFTSTSESIRRACRQRLTLPSLRVTS